MELLVFKKKLKIIDEPNTVFEQIYSENYDKNSYYRDNRLYELIQNDIEIDKYRGYETLSVEFKIVNVADDDFIKVEV